jgi:hypothetical protein
MYPMPSYGAALGPDANAAGGTVSGQGNSFDRWGNLMRWVHSPDNDYDLLERSAYFAQIHFPRCRRIIGDLE